MSNNLLNTIFINYFNIKKNRHLISSTKNYINDINTHLIGVFDKSINLWYNAWNIHNFNNAKTNKSKELLKYFIDFDISNINVNSERYINVNIIKSILCNSKIYINEEKTQLDLIIATFLYFTKNNMYIIEISDNLIFYYCFIL
jgi:hypothetical protein